MDEAVLRMGALPIEPDAKPTVLAPRPSSREQTGLSEPLLNSLLLKQLYRSGVLDLPQLSRRAALPGSVIEPQLQFLRREGLLEVRSGAEAVGGIRYLLTAQGRESALQALAKDGYIGPAPVPLETYARVVEAQSFGNRPITREEVLDVFSETVISEQLLDRLGPALQSGRSIFMYGPPGTGKSYISRKMAALLLGPVLIPHAVSVDETVMQFFDPAIHHPLRDDEHTGHRLSDGFDARFSLCRRPVAITGGELTLADLELGFDTATHTFRMPLHLRTNGGMLLIDDLGRQAIPPAALLNRWIVPMEEHRDYLNLPGGQHLVIPFDLVLVFSTNIDPLELADEAFLRRIGHKIHFDHIDADEYRSIWQQECRRHGVTYQRVVIDYLLQHFHQGRDVPLLPCHPRDLLELAITYCHYHGVSPVLSSESVEWAWENHFIKLS